MAHRNSLFSAMAMVLVCGFVLAGCGSKDPLEGTWTMTVDGETVTLLFYGGQVGVEGFGDDMGPYTFEKNVGTIDTGLGEIPFTLNGKTIKMNIFGDEYTFTRDTNTSTPKALAGEWIADDGYKLVFISNMVIVTDEDGDRQFGPYTFADNQGEINYAPFIVSGKTLTINPEYEDYKTVFTLGGKK
ncbi:MAG: hypothetical protein LBF63_03895 [Treponema sp.]|jgi:hypothetical protein|nr:hypothetical protein [Treponema sp.]